MCGEYGLIMLHTSDAPDHPPVVLEVAARAWGDVATAEVHAVSAATTTPRSGPIVPVRATVVDRATVHIAGIDKIIRI